MSGKKKEGVLTVNQIQILKNWTIGLSLEPKNMVMTPKFYVRNLYFEVNGACFDDHVIHALLRTNYHKSN